MKPKFFAHQAESLGQGVVGVAVATPAAEGIDPTEGLTKYRQAFLIPLGDMVADPDQPRKEFDEEDLRRLASSLRSHGQLQPIGVRHDRILGKWVVTHGERRLRAAHIAGLKTLRCEVAVAADAELAPGELLEKQLVENAQRSNLKPIEAAHAYRQIMELRNLNGKEVAELLKLSPSDVTKALDLLDLPAPVQAMVEQGVISKTAGSMIAHAPEHEQVELAREVAARRLPTTEVNRRVRGEATETITLKPGQGVVVKLTFPAGMERPEVVKLVRRSLGNL